MEINISMLTAIFLFIISIILIISTSLTLISQVKNIIKERKMKKKAKELENELRELDKALFKAITSIIFDDNKEEINKKEKNTKATKSNKKED